MHLVNKSTLNNLGSKYIVHLLVNIIVFSALVFIIPIRFETNDDVGMLTIASGTYSGTPDAHLVFINYIYGFFVSYLYKLYNGIEWYTVLFSIINIVSWSILFWRLFIVKSSLILKILSVIVFLSLEVYCILSLQFTTTSAICAMGAIVLFLSNQNYRSRLLAILLFSLGSLIRFDAACLVLLLSVPIFLNELLSLERKQISRYILGCSFLVLLPFVFKFIDSKIYDYNQEWRYFKEYNLLRGKINDNPNAYKLKELPPDIIEQDLILLLNFFPDCNVMNLEILKDITARMGDVKIEEKIKNIIPNTFEYKVHILLILMLSFSLLVLQTGRKERCVIALVPILFVFAIIFVSLNAILKVRVFVSMLLPVCWGLFILSSNLEKPKRKSQLGFYLSSLFFLVFFIISLYIYNILPTIKSNEKKANYTGLITLDVVEHLRTLNEECIVQYQGCLMLQRLSPFEISEYSRGYKTAHLGWLSHIPFNKNVFESYKDIIDNNLILIYIDHVDRLVDPLQKSVLYHYGMNVEPIVVYETDVYCLLRLEKVD